MAITYARVKSCCGAGQIDGLEMQTGIEASSKIKAVIEKHTKPETTFDGIKAVIITAKDAGYAQGMGVGAIFAVTNEDQQDLVQMLLKFGFKRKEKFTWNSKEWKIWVLDLNDTTAKEISQLKLKD